LAQLEGAQLLCGEICGDGGAQDNFEFIRWICSEGAKLTSAAGKIKSGH